MRYVTVLLLAFCSLSLSGTSMAQQKQVVVVVGRDTSATPLLLAGVKDALKAAGLVEGKQYNLSLQSIDAQGGDLNRRAQAAIAGKPDIIVALTAPAALAVLAQESKIPLLFGDVYDADAGRLTAAQISVTAPVAGVISSIAPSRQVELIRTLAPGAKRIGVLYRAGSPTSLALVKPLTEALSKFGLVLIESSVNRSADVGAAARSMISKVDVFFSIDDATVSQAYPALVKVAIDAKLPLIASQAQAVAQGALAGLEFNQREVGQQMGRLLVKLLRGNALGATPIETIAKPALWINQETARKLGLVLPDAVMKSAAQILDR